MRHAVRSPAKTLGLAGLALAALGAEASCGSAFCTLNTDWDTLGVQQYAGRTVLDLRYEYIPQEALYRSRTRQSRAEVQEDIVENKTHNQNLLLAVDHALTPNWGLNVALPLVSRDHRHTLDPAGTPTAESWNFSRQGDLRLLGRYQMALDAQSTLGLQAGAKFATGSYRVRNADGTPAERALQPGSGSTDALLGAFYAHRPQFAGLSVFVQGQVQTALASRDAFTPGNQYSLTGGLSWPYSNKVSLLPQANALVKKRDAGANAEPDLSGGRHLFASPGLSYALGAGSRVYSYLQAPLYRNVNGTPLTADGSLVAGFTQPFRVPSSPASPPAAGFRPG